MAIGDTAYVNVVREQLLAGLFAIKRLTRRE